jgi:tetratricopeptide (TPR) repeat protein
MEELYSQARQLKARGDWPAAEAAYRQVLQEQPELLNAWINLGFVQRKQGRPSDAEASQRRAAQLDPGNFMAALNLGSALFDQERYAEAAEWFQRTVELNPECAEGHNNLGHACLRQWGVSSIPHFIRALELKPDYFESADGIGLAMFHIGRYDEAIGALQAALKIRPQSHAVRLCLARTYLAARRFNEATRDFEQLARDYPNMPAARSGMAAMLARQGKYTKPLAMFEAALREDPEDVWAHFQYAMLLLRAGDYSAGWRHYDDARPRLNEGFALSLNRGFREPRWQGESLAGKTLLIIAEQGIGDEVMFASVIGEIAAEAAHIILECDSRLTGLFQRSFPEATIVGVNRKKNRQWYLELPQRLGTLPAFDLWVPTGSLPRYRRNEAVKFPAHTGYLKPDPARVDHWRGQLAGFGDGLKVGVSWRGGTAVTNGAARSLDLSELRPILGQPGVQLFNLQYGERTADIARFEAESGIRIHDPWPEVIDDFDDCAALVSALDLVISVCTSLVHLSGAIGHPVWVMAPYVAEWRYGREGSSIVWYPSARMFRQNRDGDWHSVISGVTRELRWLLAERRQGEK